MTVSKNQGQAPSLAAQADLLEVQEQLVSMSQRARMWRATAAAQEERAVAAEAALEAANKELAELRGKPKK